MKKIIFLLPVLILAFLFGCENIIDEVADYKSIHQTEELTVSENGYLIFKDQECYNRISDALDKMTDDQFIAWEKEVGFQSAQTYLSLVDEQIERIQSIEEFEQLKHKYSHKLFFEEDGSVRLSFYATAWDRVLNVDGVMKIGNKLFKFEKNREIIISDGNNDDLLNLNSILGDTAKVHIFYPLSAINKSSLKSVTWGSLRSGVVKTGDNLGDSKLSYDLQLISYNYTGYGATNPPVLYTEAGFCLKLNMQQQRKGLFGWYNNVTMYCFINHSHRIEYDKPIRWDYVPGLGYISITPPVHVCEIKSIPDATWGETKYGCTCTFHNYYFVDELRWEHVEPQINYLNITFWSRGIGYQNDVTINYSNI